MAENETYIVDDTNEKWRAEIEFYGKTAWLSFRTKPEGMPIQGRVDGTLGWKDIKTGVDGLEMTPDDGAFIVDFSDRDDGRTDRIKRGLIEYFTGVYEKNKEKFAKRLERDAKDYEDMANTVFCQSCGRAVDKRKPKLFGTEADGEINLEYCSKCYKKGAFTEDLTMEQAVDKAVDTWAKNLSDDKEWLKKSFLTEKFPSLKRWRKGF